LFEFEIHLKHFLLIIKILLEQRKEALCFLFIFYKYMDIISKYKIT